MKRAYRNLNAWAIAGLLGTSAFVQAQTWDGEGIDNNWTTAENWVGNAVPGTNPIINFSGVGVGTNNDFTANKQFNGINFNGGAGAFALGGNAITLGGNVANNSASKQTISLSFVLNGNRIINTRYGDITINGNISNNGSNKELTKEGLGVLELTGTNEWGGRTNHRGGTILLNGGAPNLTSTELWFGQYNDGNNAALEVQGGNFAYGGNLSVLNRGANVIKAGANVGIAFNQATAFSVTSWGTLHFDVSAPNSSVSFATAPVVHHTTLNLRIAQTTIKDGSSSKTAFATSVQDGAGFKIVRLTGLSDLSAAIPPSTSVFSNASVNGSFEVAAGGRSLNSLTIQGSGTMTGGLLDVREILMEEETGNYTFSNARVGSSTVSHGFFVHQNSEVGVLTFDNTQIMMADAIGAFAKTGPGIVRISASSTGSYTGDTAIQSGMLDVDGTLTRTASVNVYDGATLVGGGSIGSVSNQTAARIRAGGTLGGSTSEALAITGTLALDSDSKFAFTLGTGADSVSVTGAVNLASNVTLTLILGGAPVLDTPIYLLTSDTGINGNFVYNNAVISNEDTFTLGGYDFTYFQNANSIWVVAVPEPSVVALFGIGLSVLLLRRRRI